MPFLLLSLLLHISRLHINPQLRPTDNNILLPIPMVLQQFLRDFTSPLAHLSLPLASLLSMSLLRLTLFVLLCLRLVMAMVGIAELLGYDGRGLFSGCHGFDSVLFVGVGLVLKVWGLGMDGLVFFYGFL